MIILALANPNEKEILAIKVSALPANPMINNESTLVNYLYTLSDGMYRLVSSEDRQQSITNLVNCAIDINDFARWSEALVNITARQDLVDIGNKYAQQFLDDHGLSMQDC